VIVNPLLSGAAQAAPLVNFRLINPAFFAGRLIGGKQRDALIFII